MLVIEIALSALSILWIVKGAVDYGVLTGQAPGGGLFPIIGGLILLLCCVLDIVLRIKRKEPLNGEKFEGPDEYIMLGWVPRVLRPIAVTLYGFGSMFVLEYLGFIPCVFLTCFVWLFFISRRPALRAFLTSVVTTGILYSIFVAWLNIPFPKGLF